MHSHGSTDNSDHDREGLTLRLKGSLPVEAAIAVLPFGGQYREEPLRFKKARSVFMIKEDCVWNRF